MTQGRKDGNQSSEEDINSPEYQRTFRAAALLANLSARIDPDDERRQKQMDRILRRAKESK